MIPNAAGVVNNEVPFVDQQSYGPVLPEYMDMKMSNGVTITDYMYYKQNETRNDVVMNYTQTVDSVPKSFL